MSALRRIDKSSPTSEERELIRIDIENKSKLCNNQNYNCTLPRLDGFEYCFRHILQDPAGHYKQCAYTYGNGRKCSNALPKYDTKKDPTLTSLCFEHSRQAQLNKTRAAVGKLKYVDTNDVLLSNLAHHVFVDESKCKQKKTLRNNCQDEEIDVVSPHEETFVSFKNVHDVDTTVQRPKRRRILDYASDSSNDLEPITLRNTANGFEFDNSDADSTDSDDDLLKHAEIYTRQEVLRLSEAKLTKLQSLYIEQINQLHHLLKDRRRKYLLALRKEREILCSIHDQIKDSRRERLLYKQQKAYNTYHQRNGIEAVLHKKLKEKRAKVGDSYGVYKPSSFTKCHFTEGGVKCTARALPCCKYCRKHILEDKKQSLFRACSIDKAGVVCQEAIPCIFDDSTCILHMPLPAIKHFVQKKYESETEDEDTVGASADVAVKQEKEETDIKPLMNENIQNTKQENLATPSNTDKELLSLPKETVN